MSHFMLRKLQRTIYQPKGIHGFWESRVPELFFQEYDLITGKAEYINKPLETTWEFIQESYFAVRLCLIN